MNHAIVVEVVFCAEVLAGFTCFAHLSEPPGVFVDPENICLIHF
jgi:hypothetical protein